MSEETTGAKFVEETTAAVRRLATFASLTELDVVDDTSDVELSDGTYVTIRGLSRFELINHGKNTDDSALIEARNVAACLVEPPLSLGQAQAWQKRARANGDWSRVTRAIRDMSGLGEGADKSDLREV